MMWIIYFGGIVGSLSFLLFSGFIVCGLIGLISISSYVNKKPSDIEGSKATLRLFRLCGTISTLFIFIWVFLPNRETIYSMAGVYVGEQIMTSPEAKQVFSKSFEIINVKLDEIINDSMKKKEKERGLGEK